MKTRNVHDFPGIEQEIHMGVGAILGFVKGTEHENDPRLARFRAAADAAIDLIYETHTDDEIAAGQTCASCMDSTARAAGWTPGDGTTWVHKATHTTAATLADVIARLDRDAL